MLERGINEFVAPGSPAQHELQQLTSQVQLFTQAVLTT
jgi:hypothetical protein